MPKLHLGVVSTFPPREDGIATFTRDLLDGVRAYRPHLAPRIAAITEPGASYAYPPEVRWKITEGRCASYVTAGKTLARASVALILLQHEFGLYGKLGEPLLDHTPALLDALTARGKLIVTTLHTVLPRPSGQVRETLRYLCERSAATVVLANTAVRLLTMEYGVDPARLTMIPHGVPAICPEDTERMKRALRLSGCTILCTFGLLHRRKGIENVVRALPAIVGRHPDVRYLIVGETHPYDRGIEGESYRDELAALAESLGMSPYLRFVNHYLDEASLLRYLQATDVYITPYRDATQISSGTLAYALGCGRAVVSTPYAYAVEALADGRGLLAAFDCPEQVAACVNRYLDDPDLRAQTQERALAYGSELAWPRVGARYAELFERVACT